MNTEVQRVPAEAATRDISAAILHLEKRPIEARHASALLDDLSRHIDENFVFLLDEPTIEAFHVLKRHDPTSFLLYRRRIALYDKVAVQLLDEALRNARSRGSSRRLMSLEQLIAHAPARWLIEDLMPENGLCLLYGESQSGKTFLALDAIFAILSGVPWFGHKTKQGSAFYVAAEGRLRDRVCAYIQHHGLEIANLKELTVLEETLDLCGSTADLDWLCAEIESRVVASGPISIVVLDTLARVMHGADENSAKDMGALIAAMNRIAEISGGMVLGIHHAGKDVQRGARGHSSLRAAADTEIQVLRNAADVRLATVTKQRDAADGTVLSFRLETVELDKGSASCVVVSADPSPADLSASAKITAGAALTKAAQIAYRTFEVSERQQKARTDQNSNGEPDPDEPLVVADTEWSFIFTQEYARSEVATKKAFWRAKTELQRAGLIHQVEEGWSRSRAPSGHRTFGDIVLKCPTGQKGTDRTPP